jgi:hypothetical protein
MHARALAALLFSLGCTATPTGHDAGTTSCPPLAPADGDTCADAAALCVYEHCASEGVVRASCVVGDASGGRWSVTTTPCGACNGSACTAGTVCMQREGGALITSCESHACGAGPLGCDCLCGAGTECMIEPYAGDGPIYTCRSSCGASLCP